MFSDHATICLKKLSNLFLRQPDSIFLELHLEMNITIFRLVDNDLSTVNIIGYFFVVYIHTILCELIKAKLRTVQGFALHNSFGAKLPLGPLISLEQKREFSCPVSPLPIVRLSFC